jgi:2'-5' RNA ligase
MRCFLAVEPSDAVRACVARGGRDVAVALGPHAERVKWVEAENLHLTLHFFGQLDAARVELVAQALRRPWPVGSFRTGIVGAGCFPRPAAPRVIWMGIGRGASELVALHGAVQERLAPLGLADAANARPFSPHLTVGRIRDGRPARAPGHGSDRRSPRAFAAALAAALDARSFDCGGFTVDRLTLFESRLSPKGATYHAVSTFALSG